MKAVVSVSERWCEYVCVCVNVCVFTGVAAAWCWACGGGGPGWGLVPRAGSLWGALLLLPGGAEGRVAWRSVLQEALRYRPMSPSPALAWARYLAGLQQGSHAP